MQFQDLCRTLFLENPLSLIDTGRCLFLAECFLTDLKFHHCLQIHFREWISAGANSTR